MIRAELLMAEDFLPLNDVVWGVYLLSSIKISEEYVYLLIDGDKYHSRLGDGLRFARSLDQLQTHIHENDLFSFARRIVAKLGTAHSSPPT